MTIGEIWKQLGSFVLSHTLKVLKMTKMRGVKNEAMGVYLSKWPLVKFENNEAVSFFLNTFLFMEWEFVLPEKLAQHWISLRGRLLRKRNTP